MGPDPPRSDEPTTEDDPVADPLRSPDSNGDTGDYPGAPRWVKVSGIIVLVVVMLFVILLFTRGPGGHGPGRHLSSDVIGDPTPLRSATVDRTPGGGNPCGQASSVRGHG